MSTKHLVTKHAADCRMVFGRLDPGCARCVELAEGAPRRTAGWDRFTRRQAQDAQRLHEIRTHNCKAAGCGPVCTAFDY